MSHALQGTESPGTVSKLLGSKRVCSQKTDHSAPSENCTQERVEKLREVAKDSQRMNEWVDVLDVNMERGTQEQEGKCGQKGSQPLMRRSSLTEYTHWVPRTKTHFIYICKSF